MGKARLLLLFLLCLFTHSTFSLDSVSTKFFNNSQVEGQTSVRGNKAKSSSDYNHSTVSENIKPDENRHLQILVRKISNNRSFKRRQPQNFISVDAYISKESDSSSENIERLPGKRIQSRSFADPVKSIPQTRELSGEYGVMSPTEFRKKIRKPVISEETEEEAQLPPTTSMPTRPPFWLRRKLKTQLLESLESNNEFPDDSNDELVTLRRLFPKRSTTPGPPTTRHIHTWKNRRVIEIGSSESIEIVKRRKHKHGKVPSPHTTLGPQISTVPSKV